MAKESYWKDVKTGCIWITLSEKLSDEYQYFLDEYPTPWDLTPIDSI